MPFLNRNLFAFAFLGLLLAFSTVSAQRGFQLGLRVNPQWTNIMNSSYPDSLSTKMTYGVAFGGSVGYGFNDRGSVLVEAFYSSQGQHFEYTYANPNGDVNGDGNVDEFNVISEVRTRYLKFPVLFKYGMNQERKYAFYGFLGPQFEYLMSVDARDNDVRYRPDYDPYVETANFPKEDIDPYNRFNVSLVGGAGLDIKLRFNLKMNIQVRADYGFLDIRDTELEFSERRNGVVNTLNYWEDYRRTPDASRNMNVGLTLGFTYIFIPRFHY